MDLLGFGWFRTKGYGKVLLRSVGVGYGSSVCIKIRLGSLPCAPPPPPPKKNAFDTSGCLVTRHFHFFPDKDKP